MLSVVHNDLKMGDLYVCLNWYSCYKSSYLGKEALLNATTNGTKRSYCLSSLNAL